MANPLDDIWELGIITLLGDFCFSSLYWKRFKLFSEYQEIVLRMKITHVEFLDLLKIIWLPKQRQSS